MQQRRDTCAPRSSVSRRTPTPQCTSNDRRSDLCAHDQRPPTNKLKLPQKAHQARQCTCPQSCRSGTRFRYRGERCDAAGHASRSAALQRGREHGRRDRRRPRLVIPAADGPRPVRVFRVVHTRTRDFRKRPGIVVTGFCKRRGRRWFQVATGTTSDASQSTEETTVSSTLRAVSIRAHRSQRRLRKWQNGHGYRARN